MLDVLQTALQLHARLRVQFAERAVAVRPLNQLSRLRATFADQKGDARGVGQIDPLSHRSERREHRVNDVQRLLDVVGGAVEEEFLLAVVDDAVGAAVSDDGVEEKVLLQLEVGQLGGREGAVMHG